ncbi:MAG: hypothetical protein ABI665_17625 [Vicinamibacterales bacterium]
MTPDNAWRSLEQLPQLTPSTARATRVSVKCRQRMFRRTALASRRRPRFTAEFAVIGVFCVVYFLAVARDAIRFLMG